MSDEKPLGRCAYGTIPHLPGSRRGPGDHGCNDGITRILTRKARDKHDRIIITEKLDGANVAVANIGGEIVPLGRSGHRADLSPWEHLRQFAAWATGSPEQCEMFECLLCEGEWVSGEWLGLAHGTRYDLGGSRQPFAAFDIFCHGSPVAWQEVSRAPWKTLYHRCEWAGIATVPLLHDGAPLSIADALALLGEHGRYGAIDPAEGCVWRLERDGVWESLAKYVRPEKVDGKYLPEESGQPPVWNWGIEA